MKIALGAEGAYFEERALGVELHWGRGGGERLTADVADDAAEGSAALKAALESGLVVILGDDGLAAKSLSELAVIAASLGIQLKRAKKADVIAAIEAAQVAQPDPAADQGGTNVPADDPEASTSGEAGAPPATE